jgi:RNA polymerase sigma-70 factor (ECF subfamily)
MNPSDNDLVKKVRKGEQDAFKVLYLKYSDLLFAYIIHNLSNNQDIAPDIWQETWCIAVEKLDNFQFKSSFFTWLCAIAKNKIYDYYRQTKRQDSFVSAGKIHFDIDSEEIENELIDVETRSDVVTVLANLTDKYNYLLKAKYIENKSTDEIAVVIGKSYKATESMLTRARESFRKKFKQNFREPCRTK